MLSYELDVQTMNIVLETVSAFLKRGRDKTIETCTKEQFSKDECVYVSAVFAALNWGLVLHWENGKSRLLWIKDSKPVEKKIIDPAFYGSSLTDAFIQMERDLLEQKADSLADLTEYLKKSQRTED